MQNFSLQVAGRKGQDFVVRVEFIKESHMVLDSLKMKHIRVPLFNRSIILKCTGLTGSKKTDLKLESATVQQSNSKWLVCADDGSEFEFKV